MLVDHEAVLSDFKAFLSTKPHFGSRELAAKLIELEGRHALDESAPERALRMYSVQLGEDLRALARDEPSKDLGGSAAEVMGTHPDHQTTDQEVDGNGSSHREAVRG